MEDCKAKYDRLYRYSYRTIDTPVVHDLRKRSIPHLPGYWPSHIFLEFLPSNDLVSKLSNALDTSTFSSLIQSEFGTTQPLHISLTGTCMIHGSEKNDWLDWIESLAMNLQPTLQLRLKHTLTQLKSSSREFLAIPLDECSEKLLAEFTENLEINAPQMFPKSQLDLLSLGNIFHFSIGWRNLEPNTNIESAQHHDVIQIDLPDDLAQVAISHLHVRLGNDLHVFKLG